MSKELESLKVLDKIISPLLEPILAEYEDDLNDKITANYFIVEQALLKAQEQEKVLKIIKEKNVDIDMIKDYQTVIEYNWNIRFDRYKRKELTQEEFDLLKRWTE